MDKQRTINLEAFHCEVKSNDGGFVWSFFCRTKDGGKYRINITFGLWWIGYLVRDLWAVINSKQSQIDQITKQMKGE